MKNAEPRILIVDDDPRLRATLTDILRLKGFFPLDVGVGAEALQRAQENSLDAAVIDLRLEDMSGLDLLRRLKACVPEIECIVLTGHASQASAIEAINSGAFAYLQKPFDMEQLLLLLRRAVERRVTTQTLRESEEMHRVTLESISDAVLIADDAGAFTYICPNTEAIFGYNRAEVAALGNIEALLGPALCIPAGLAAQGEIRNIERRIMTKIGEERILLVNIKQVSIRGGTRLYTCRDVSERKAAQETVRFQANLLSAVDSAVIATDLQGRVSYWNPAAERLYGWSAAEALGQNIIDLTPAQQTREQAIEIMTQLQRSESWAGEFLVRRKDGSVFPAFVIDSPIADADGRLIGVVGISNDITERRQAENALRRQLQELTALHAVTVACAEATHPDELIAVITQIIGETLYPDHLGVLLLDEAAGVLHPHYSYRGVPAEELQKRQTIPLSGSMAGQAAISGHSVRAADVRQAADYLDVDTGTRSELCVPIAISGRVLGVINAESTQLDFFGDDDERLLITIAGQMATALERLRLFAETDQRAEQIGQIIRSVPDGVLLLDEDGRLLQVNPAARIYLTQLNGAGVGETITRLGDRPLMQLLTSPPGGRWHEIRQDKRIFEALARPLAAGPTSGGWVLLLRDVTRQREVQEQLQRQERLVAVGQLAAGIAHDFNNQLGAILLHAQLLGRAAVLGERERERIAIIQQQTRHTAAMIEQILDFSRRAVLERQPLELRALLAEQVALLQRTLPEHIQVTLEGAPDEYIVQADPTRMQQMVMNLAINARDAMPQGGQFSLRLQRLRLPRANDLPLAEMRPGEWVQLTVRDSGMGMTPEVQAHLFEPFFTTKPPGTGTGLGLAQVYGIVGQHDGHITVQSRLGEGTTFTIYLPALVTTVDKEMSAPEEYLPPGEGRLLLVVEDNESLRAALAEYLELCGYRVLAASDGVEALQVLISAGESPVLTLSDVVMPRMGGVALLHALRRLGHHMPVILLTGHPLDEAEMRPLRSQGAAAWLTKPVQITDLARAIGQAFAGGSRK